uniref:Uncharacterized protein n=1 Tax=Anguilla anguilla TaxID=7936 RepID=A0A0E9TNB5_ANGAN
MVRFYQAQVKNANSISEFIAQAGYLANQYVSADLRSAHVSLN